MNHYLFYSASHNGYFNALSDSFNEQVVIRAKNDLEIKQLAVDITRKCKTDIRVIKLTEHFLTEVSYESEKEQMARIAGVLPEKLAKWAIKKMLDEQSERSYDKNDLMQHFQDMVDELENCISCENVRQ
jgi:hypothetical protein